MPKHQIAVLTSDHSLIEKAKTLAHDLNLAFIFGFESKEVAQYQFLLLVTPNCLALQKTNDQKMSPFYIDFLSKQMRHRFKHKGLRSEFLARAIGIHPREKPYIVDATAGLGRDSFILAALGYEITMLEVSPIMHALLQDALERAKRGIDCRMGHSMFEGPLLKTSRGRLSDQGWYGALIPGSPFLKTWNGPYDNRGPIDDEQFSQVIDRMHLIHADAISWLKNHSLNIADRPDVIYLDPMFPVKKKSASAKKEMIILQELLENSKDNARSLLELSLTCTKARVVVKRPRLAAFLSLNPPDFSIKGKSSRFDVYLVQKEHLITVSS